MKKRMMSLLSICLSIYLMPTGIIKADENSTNKVILTVEKAQNVMIGNSLQLKADQMNIEDLKIELEDILELAEKRKNVPGLNVENYGTYRKEERVDPINAQMNYDIALREYRQEEETERLEILQDYYELYEQGIEKENEERYYEIQQDEYNQLVKQEGLGQVSSFEVKQKEIDLEKAKTNLEILHREYERKQSQLFDTLGIDDPENYTIRFEGLDEIRYPLPSLEEILQKLDDTISVYKSIVAEQVAKIVLEYTDDYYKEGTSAYIEANHDRTIAVMNLRDARLQQEYQMQSDYYSLMDLQEDLILSRKNLSLLQKELDMTKAQYDLGLTVEMDVRKAKASLDAAELAYSKLVHQYEITKGQMIIAYELYETEEK